MHYFLLLLLAQYSPSNYIERCIALISFFLCKMSSVICVFIFSMASFSPSQFLLVVDTSSIPIYFSKISKIKLCRHCREAKSLCTLFQFLPLEVYIDKVLFAEITAQQNHGHGFRLHMTLPYIMLAVS